MHAIGLDAENRFLRKCGDAKNIGFVFRRIFGIAFGQRTGQDRKLPKHPQRLILMLPKRFKCGLLITLISDSLAP